MAAAASRQQPRPIAAVPPQDAGDLPGGSASRSASINQLAAAFVAVQIEIDPIVKNRSADTSHYVTNFADLKSILDAVLPILNKHGLALAQFPGNDGAGRATLDTYLMHKSGEFISASQLLSPAKNDPQGLGSAITFARRYAACAILNIRTYDDDGNAGSGHDSNIGQASPRQQKGRQQAPPAPPAPPADTPPRPPQAAPPNPLAAVGWSDLDEGARRHKAVSEQISQLKAAGPDAPGLAEVQAYVKEHRWPMHPDRLDALGFLIAKAHTPPQRPQEAPGGPPGSVGAADGSSAQDGAQSGQSGNICPFCDCPSDDGRPTVVVNGDDGLPRTWHVDCQMDWAAEGDGRPM
ncbi:MAG TPA: ERF family protein [Acidimicrobiales bacterium]